MPLIDVSLVQGRTPEQLRELVSSLTHAAATALEVSQGSVRVLIREVPSELWAAGDETIAERLAEREHSEDP